MPFRDLLTLINQPYWTWGTIYSEDVVMPIKKVEEGNLVYYFLLPGFNKDNLEVTQDNNTVSISGKRDGNGVGDDVVNLAFNIKYSGDINASIQDGILKIVVTNVGDESKRIELK